MYRSGGKRLLDFVSAVLLLFMVSPLLAIVAAAVRLWLGAPILFRQQRPGQHGHPFTLLKFRTMSTATSADGGLLPDAQRMTGFGSFLRSSSLDELPELFNVLKGEMSLVGPRPLLLRYLPRYTPEQMMRHDVMPGITGWAQVNGRNDISWERRFALDIWYVQHLSLRLDLYILLLTLWRVVRREHIAQEGHVTMREFMGTSLDLGDVDSGRPQG